MTPQRTLTCWICHNQVPINECKFDEFGKPVHEKCSLERVALLNEAKATVLQAQRSEKVKSGQAA